MARFVIFVVVAALAALTRCEQRGLALESLCVIIRQKNMTPPATPPALDVRALCADRNLFNDDTKTKVDITGKPLTGLKIKLDDMNKNFDKIVDENDQEITLPIVVYDAVSNKLVAIIDPTTGQAINIGFIKIEISTKEVVQFEDAAGDVLVTIPEDSTIKIMTQENDILVVLPKDQP